MAHALPEQSFSFFENVKNGSVTGPKQNRFFWTSIPKFPNDGKSVQLAMVVALENKFGIQFLKVSVFLERITGFLCIRLLYIVYKVCPCKLCVVLERSKYKLRLIFPKHPAYLGIYIYIYIYITTCENKASSCY